jgi:hypothetical protein
MRTFDKPDKQDYLDISLSPFTLSDMSQSPLPETLT